MSISDEQFVDDRFYELEDVFAWFEGEIPNPYTRLSLADQTLAAVYLMITEIDNGGVEQWMSNSTGDFYDETLSALERIGAADTANLLVRVTALLPGGRLEKDPGKRFEQWKHLRPSEKRQFEIVGSQISSDGERLLHLIRDFWNRKQESRSRAEVTLGAPATDDSEAGTALEEVQSKRLIESQGPLMTPDECFLVNTCAEVESAVERQVGPSGFTRIGVVTYEALLSIGTKSFTAYILSDLYENVDRGGLRRRNKISCPS